MTKDISGNSTYLCRQMATLIFRAIHLYWQGTPFQKPGQQPQREVRHQHLGQFGYFGYPIFANFLHHRPRPDPVDRPRP